MLLLPPRTRKGLSHLLAPAIEVGTLPWPEFWGAWAWGDGILDARMWPGASSSRTSAKKEEGELLWHP